MTPTEDVRNNLADLKHMEGETSENFAMRRYDLQMEIYSAWAMQDLWKPFHTLSQEVQESWIETAKQIIEKEKV